MSKFISQSCKTIAIIAVLGLLQACSALRMGYNQASTLGYWWLDGYFDFNSEQSPQVREDIAKLLAWHRSSELPAYAALLQKLQPQMLQDVSPAQACAVYDEVRGFFDVALDRALPAMAAIAPTLTPQQLEHLERKYQKNKDEFNRDYLKGNAADRHTKRVKQAVERSNMLYGALEEPQLAAIDAAVVASSFDAAQSMKERQRRQSEALQMVRKIVAEKPPQYQVQNMLKAYFDRSLVSPDPMHRAYSDKLMQEACESFASVHASTTSTQRAKAVKTLKGYEADLRALASPPK